jgi:hypothetical protein
MDATKGGTVFVNTWRNTTVLPSAIDPLHKNKVGIITRESFDSPESPNSEPVVWQLDVTGSMSLLPSKVIAKVGKTMSLLQEGKIMPNPHIMSMATTDSNGDPFPVQATQFETSNEIEDSLLKFVLGGGGGASGSEPAHETYGLGMLFASHYCNMDNLTKRGKKGFYFIVGDEFAYDEVSIAHAKKYLDIDLEAPIKFDQILELLQEKFEVFWLYPQEANYYTARPSIRAHWEKVFKEKFIVLPDVDYMAEMMVALIAQFKGISPSKVTTLFKTTNTPLAAIEKINTSLAALRGLNPIEEEGELISAAD